MTYFFLYNPKKVHLLLKFSTRRNLLCFFSHQCYLYLRRLQLFEIRPKFDFYLGGPILHISDFLYYMLLYQSIHCVFFIGISVLNYNFNKRYNFRYVFTDSGNIIWIHNIQSSHAFEKAIFPISGKFWKIFFCSFDLWIILSPISVMFMHRFTS